MKPASNSPDSVEQRIKAEASRLGFSLCGITTADPPVDYDRYERWLADSCHAGMEYLAQERHRSLRRDPTRLVAGVKTIVSLGWSYPLRNLDTKLINDQTWVAGYASGEDYHVTLARKMEGLAVFIKNFFDKDIEIRGFTDSAPILEREIAVRAGLGWIGKNSNLISPLVGSSFLLGELFINKSLQPDQPFQKDHCGSCTRCLQACPTGCIRPDRTIDSRECLSYLTIEHKRIISVEMHQSLGNWIFGCDICQMVCPWNQKGNSKSEPSQLINWSVDQVVELLFLSSDDYLDRFKNTAISRTKLKGLQRNALILLGNLHDPSVLPQLQRYLEITTDTDLIETAHSVIARIEKIN